MVKTSPSSTGSVGLIPGQEAEIPCDLWSEYQNIKPKQYCNQFNKDFNNGVHHTHTHTKDSLGDSNAEGPQTYLEKAYSYFMPGPVPDLQTRCVIGTD